MTDSKVITSAANPIVKKIKSLAQKKYRDEENLFVVEGLRHVTDALEKGWTADTIAYTSGAAKNLKLPKTGAYFVETTEDLLSRMTGRENTQDVIGVFKPRWTPLKDVKNGIWAGLENIRDPGNLGTIVRTIHASGGAGVILIGQTCDPWSPEAVRASMGSFAHVSFVRATPSEFSSWRSSFNGPVVGTHVVEAADYRDVKIDPSMILLMGSESHGLSPEMVRACDHLAKIPMAAGAESLNLAVATGIMLYEIHRRLK